MNSLLSSELGPVFSKWTTFKNAAKNIANNSSGSNFPFQIQGFQGSSAGFFVSECTEERRNLLFLNRQYEGTGRYGKSPELNAHNAALLDSLVIVPSEKEAQDVKSDLEASIGENADIYLLPWWGLVPYRPAAPGSAVFGKRAGVLARLSVSKRELNSSSRPQIFIATLRSLETPVPPPDYIRSLVFPLKKGIEIDPASLAEKLTSIGYTRVPKVGVEGEFTLRGEVLDIFTPGEEEATRIVFDFDTIETIKTFNASNQSTTGEKDFLLVYPMKEVVWKSELVDKLSRYFDSVSPEKAAPGNIFFTLTDEAKKAQEKLLEELNSKGESSGEELFYPVIFDRRYSLLDYLDPESSVFYFDYDRLLNTRESFQRETEGLFRTARQTFPVLPPEVQYIPFEELSQSHKRSVLFRTLKTEADETSDDKPLQIDCDPPRNFLGNFNYLKEQLTSLQADGWKIIVYADNPNQAVRINEILKDFTQKSAEEGAAQNAKSGKVFYPLTILPKAISSGFSIPEEKVIFIQENEIFGRRRQPPKSLHRVKSQAIDTFVDLNEGDYVVHVNYGIGIFKGIQRVKAMGNERDYIKLEYADEEFVFVPIEQVNLVQRYIGNEGEAPKIDRIGSKSWENRKNKVKQAVEDLAKKLIDLYSRRKASRGFPFPKDSEWQTAFEAAFPYEDTPDQFNVTKEIKADMEKPVPMDRLVCGDVGYGKTEIAMRAAFKAVMGGKQVAFLAPTTILAEQHYENCVERFSNFPVQIAVLSRFVSHAEQKKTLAKLAAGEIDIIVGTHRIIQKDVVFKDLGLMIIDEEQRFGVKDKERLKALKNNIDSLSMSATPIPRTLHMSLLKIRDMSLLTTPPQNRQPIETIVDAYDEGKVAQAIRREVERGGQVFYLHNRVESLEETRLKLQRIVPEMMVETAHGKMTSEELDAIFRRFKLGGFHILVATTIIENGIDIPNVNTIIIDRADMYGVSQLYQLRGRVGRSDRQAYAYLFYPENKVLSEVAMKRLQVISDFTELGSGFKIAMKDMEIRGAGNLLGRDQSGDVYSVGFDLYVKLLNEAVQALTDSNFKQENEVLMELEYTGFIPDSYVHNLQTKMEIYKKIAGVQTKDELSSVYSELEDRFGPVPDEVASLLSLAEVRIIAKKLDISSLKERKGVIELVFSKVAKISIDKVLKLIKESGGRVRLNAAKPNELFLEAGKIGLKEKSEFIREKLEMLEI